MPVESVNFTEILTQNNFVCKAIFYIFENKSARICLCKAIFYIFGNYSPKQRFMYVIVLAGMAVDDPAIRNANRRGSRESIRRKDPTSFITFQQFARKPQTCDSQLLVPRNAIRKEEVQFGNPRDSRESCDRVGRLQNRKTPKTRKWEKNGQKNRIFLFFAYFLLFFPYFSYFLPISLPIF